MAPRESIKHFIQDILGCGCPEEVFRSIDVRRNVRLNSFIILDCALVVGNRLLVYLAEAGSAACIEEHLPVLVAAGKKEREEKGLNRFRLVLVADEPEAVLRPAGKLFEELRGADGKVHLHAISRKDFSLATST